MRHARTVAKFLFQIVLCAAFLAVCFSPIPATAAQNAAPISGADVYQKRCAVCHDQMSSRAPSRDVLQKMSSARILRTLDFGLMMGIAYPLKRQEREAVANFLGTKGDDLAMPKSAFCPATVPILSGYLLSERSAGTWAGWSPTYANARFQSTESAKLAAGQVSHLKLKWAFGFPGDVTAFGAPTILHGALFIGSASGAVMALDSKTGCIHWVYQAEGPVRSAVLPIPDAIPENGRYTIGSNTPISVVFGDQIGWVYALDAKTGHLLWKKRADDHEATRLTGSPTSYQGAVFIPAASWEESRSVDPQYPCCTFRGSVTAFRVTDGSVIWKTYTVDEPKRIGTNSAGAAQWGPSGVPVWSAPTVDLQRGLLYITTGDNYSLPASRDSDAVMALEIKTGRIVWTQQVTTGDVYTSACRTKGANCPPPPDNGPDADFGSSAMLVRAPNGREILLAGQKSGMVYAFDPDASGKILWKARVGKGGVNGGVQWGMASDGQKVYAAVSDVAAVMNSAGPVGGATFDPAQGGGLTALHLEDGSKAWFAPGHPCEPPKPGCSPGQSAALTVIPGAVFSGSLDGHLRAFSTEDGEMLWDFDTAKTYSTVNGVPAKGGSMDGAGPVIAGGMVFVNSGYPRNGGMPGNVLLAFAPL